MNSRRLHVVAIGTGITNMGIGQRDYLSTITGVSEDFLVAGHRRVENDFTDSLTFSANRNTVENRPVLQSQYSGRTQRLANSLFVTLHSVASAVIIGLLCLTALVILAWLTDVPYFRCTKAEGHCLPLKDSPTIRRPGVVYSSAPIQASDL